MPPLRLLMTADAVGGVWSYALDLARALAPSGYETVLALLGPAPDRAQRAAAASVPGLRLIETGLPLDWLAADEAAVRDSASAISRLATSENVDLIQLNQPAFAAEPMPRPIVAALHSCVATWWDAAGEGPLPAGFAWQTALVRAGLLRADVAVCPSRAFADHIAAIYGHGVRIDVVHNGRTAQPLGAGAIHDFALTAGRLWDKGKNVATLDRAAARLGIPFKAAGALVSPAGETVRLDHLHALGVLSGDALANCYAARPVFASAARYEPFGLAVLEAAQAGCPLVLSDIPTFRELWDGIATFVAPDDGAGFTAAIEDLIGDTPLRLARGELARRHAARFTPEAMASGMARLYRTALATRAAA